MLSPKWTGYGSFCSVNSTLPPLAIRPSKRSSLPGRSSKRTTVPWCQTAVTLQLQKKLASTNKVLFLHYSDLKKLESFFREKKV